MEMWKNMTERTVAAISQKIVESHKLLKHYMPTIYFMTATNKALKQLTSYKMHSAPTLSHNIANIYIYIYIRIYSPWLINFLMHVRSNISSVEWLVGSNAWFPCKHNAHPTLCFTVTAIISWHKIKSV